MTMIVIVTAVNRLENFSIIFSNISNIAKEMIWIRLLKV